MPTILDADRCMAAQTSQFAKCSQLYHTQTPTRNDSDKRDDCDGDISQRVCHLMMYVWSDIDSFHVVGYKNWGCPCSIYTLPSVLLHPPPPSNAWEGSTLGYRRSRSQFHCRPNGVSYFGMAPSFHLRTACFTETATLQF